MIIWVCLNIGVAEMGNASSETDHVKENQFVAVIGSLKSVEGPLVSWRILTLAHDVQHLSKIVWYSKFKIQILR